MMAMRDFDGYAVYSEEQFNKFIDYEDDKFPYIYYKNEKDEIVQVTEVFSTKEKRSNFEDAVYLGKVKWYGAFKERQIYNKKQSEEP